MMALDALRGIKIVRQIAKDFDSRPRARQIDTAAPLSSAQGASITLS